MNELSVLIRDQIAPVFQVGSPAHPPLDGAVCRFDDLDLPEYAELFRRSLFGVFLENGCAHWAANIGSPHFTLFRSRQHPDPPGVMYPGRGRAIPAYDMGAEDVFKMIQVYLKAGL